MAKQAALTMTAAAAILMMTVVVGVAEGGDRVNKTSLAGGLFWSTAKEEPDLMRKPTTEPENGDTSSASVHDEDLDGGFSSLDGMLQWAIGHSDPAKLKETARDVQRLSPSELKKRQMEIKELMEKLKMPSDAQLMQIAIDDLNNSSLSLEDRHRALQELLVLVEPIDNANELDLSIGMCTLYGFYLKRFLRFVDLDLDGYTYVHPSLEDSFATKLSVESQLNFYTDLGKLGGLAVLLRELNHPDPDIRKIAAWVLGKASQNNAVVQKQILELGALRKLMKMVKSTSVEEAIKALYAVSALIRNNLAGQEIFYAEAGDVMLQNILSDSRNDIRLRRKAVFLVADLAECQLENIDRDELPFFSNRFLLKSVVDLTASSDLDLLEKALVAIKNLLQLRTTEASIFKHFCSLDGALERIRRRLQDLTAQEDHRDYAMDVENLRREVEMIFHDKLGKVKAVPT